MEGIVHSFEEEINKGLPGIRELKVFALISRYLEFLPELIIIPKGIFWMGSDDGGYNEKPRHQVELTQYAIGKYPVTNKEYKYYIDQSGNRAPDRWQNNTYPAGKGDHPVVVRNWEGGDAYARWLSKKTGWSIKLPTEAQWEKAAGGESGLRYPWEKNMKKGSAMI